MTYADDLRRYTVQWIPQAVTLLFVELRDALGLVSPVEPSHSAFPQRGIDRDSVRTVMSREQYREQTLHRRNYFLPVFSPALFAIATQADSERAPEWVPRWKLYDRYLPEGLKVFW